MKQLGPVELYATTSQQTWTIPTNTVRLDIVNRSNWEIRYAFQASKVATGTLSFPYEYERLGPTQSGLVEPHNTGAISGGTLYYATNGSKAKFVVTAYVE